MTPAASSKAMSGSAGLPEDDCMGGGGKGDDGVGVGADAAGGDSAGGDCAGGDVASGDVVGGDGGMEAAGGGRAASPSILASRSLTRVSCSSARLISS